jgi:N-acetylneuraminic acid mutarotase
MAKPTEHFVPVEIERLETRTFLHGDLSTLGYPLGTVVPWLTPPIVTVGTSPPVVPPSPPSPPPPPPSTGVFPQNIQWKALATSPLPRAEGSAFTAGGKLYVFGGFVGPKLAVSKELDRYDPATNTWTRMADMPDTVTHAATAVDPQTGLVWVGTFFLHNGLNSSQSVYVYDPAANTWSSGPNLPAARGAGAMAIVGRELHAWGGLDVNQKGHAEHWRLNLDDTTAGWVTDTPMPKDVNHNAGVSLNGKLYSIGGIHDKVEFSSNRTDVYVYDPATRQWTAGTPLLQGLGHIGPATTVAAGHIVIAGGQPNAAGEIMVTTVVVFDPDTNAWTTNTPLPAPRKSSGTAFVDGKLYVVNGNSPFSPFLSNQLWVSS